MAGRRSANSSKSGSRHDGQPASQPATSAKSSQRRAPAAEETENGKRSNPAPPAPEGKTTTALPTTMLRATSDHHSSTSTTPPSPAWLITSPHPSIDTPSPSPSMPATRSSQSPMPLSHPRLTPPQCPIYVRIPRPAIHQSIHQPTNTTNTTKHPSHPAPPTTTPASPKKPQAKPSKNKARVARREGSRKPYLATAAGSQRPTANPTRDARTHVYGDPSDAERAFSAAAAIAAPQPLDPSNVNVNVA
ncbi:uncharacterized protein K452DRAFT_311794 [Aplosporella prunicola CBS 121167]|uniref:Uncharacterized protein n=1 Tax=Aplosporella prunicola CBS 121167 TaxID=1176127 RepID=A0A6A6B1F9_9PEZI|nr:uncharacterized protein K452DRAFT_311794 [Aplosporella prunicola CBS 121167]KAF2138009.1 hypothetical protein K452DRAFT_311794 [Aplosporella prunicola CBS 121167]